MRKHHVISPLTIEEKYIKLSQTFTFMNCTQMNLHLYHWVAKSSASITVSTGKYLTFNFTQGRNRTAVNTFHITKMDQTLASALAVRTHLCFIFLIHLSSAFYTTHCSTNFTKHKCLSKHEFLTQKTGSAKMKTQNYKCRI